MDILMSLLPWIPAVIGVIALGFLATRFIVNVGPTEIAITERRYLGKKLPPNRAFATSGEVGIQAAYLSPGLHFIFWPITSRAASVCRLQRPSLSMPTRTGSNRVRSSDATTKRAERSEISCSAERPP